jgi:hypothetical protein
MAADFIVARFKVRGGISNIHPVRWAVTAKVGALFANLGIELCEEARCELISAESIVLPM